MSRQADINAQSAELSGRVVTTPAQDFSVKVDATNLQPGTRYFYYFTSGNHTSLLGTTKTAPASGQAVDAIKFAQMSCASWRWGYFHSYNMTSRVRDLDFIVFLGDWIYEYSNDQYPAQGEAPPGRAPVLPPTQLATLEDYRVRHRLYHTDPALVEMLRSYPIIPIWDDHEVADNAYETGSGHPTSRAPYSDRVCNAVQAYFEYMPLRNPANSSTTGPAATAQPRAARTTVPGDDVTYACESSLDIYRTLSFGNIMTLSMLEERLQYRDEQLNYTNTPYIQALQNNAPDQWDSLPDLAQKRQQYYAALAAPNRTLIGPQVERLRSDFQESRLNGTVWQVLGNTVVMGPLNTPDVETAIQQTYGPVAQTVLEAILGLSTSALTEVVPASFGESARVLVGTGRYHDPVIVDGWSGYAYNREQVLDVLLGAAANPVVLSGDIHNGLLWQLQTTNRTPVAMEFTTPSVTAPGMDLLAKKLPTGGLATLTDLLDMVQRGLQLSNNQSLLYANVRKRGAVYHTVSNTTWHAEYWYIDDATVPEASWSCEAAFDIAAGSPGCAANASCTPASQMFYALGSAADPLQASGASSDAAVPGTQLYECSAEAQQRAQEQVPGQQGTSAAQAGTSAGAPFVVVVLTAVVLLGLVV